MKKIISKILAGIGALAIVVSVASLGIAADDFYSDQTPLVYTVTLNGTNSATATLVSSNVANMARSDIRIQNTASVVKLYNGSVVSNAVQIGYIAANGSVSFAAPFPELNDGVLDIYGQALLDTNTATVGVIVRSGKGRAVAR